MTATADYSDGKVPKNETAFPLCISSHENTCYYYYLLLLFFFALTQHQQQLVGSKHYYYYYYYYYNVKQAYRLNVLLSSSRRRQWLHGRAGWLSWRASAASTAASGPRSGASASSAGSIALAQHQQQLVGSKQQLMRSTELHQWTTVVVCSLHRYTTAYRRTHSTTTTGSLRPTKHATAIHPAHPMRRPVPPGRQLVRRRR